MHYELFLAILYLKIEQKKHFTEMKTSTQLTPVLLKPLSMPVSKEVVLAWFRFLKRTISIIPKKWTKKIEGYPAWCWWSKWFWALVVKPGQMTENLFVDLSQRPQLRHILVVVLAVIAQLCLISNLITTNLQIQIWSNCHRISMMML